jgi:hypothetical protein
MVYIVIEAWYPAKIAPLAGRKYIEVMQKFPWDESLGKMVLPPIQRATKDGIHAISAYECKDDKVKHVIMALGKAMLMYAELEGYHYSMDTYIDLTEAYSLIGMKGPQ